MRHTLLVLLLAGCPQGDDTAVDDTATHDATCTWDSDDEPASAGDLPLDTPQDAWICPIGDQDWYRLTVPAGDDLLRVALSVEGPISPVELTYTAWDSTVDNVLGAPLPAEAAMPEAPLSIVHRVPAGEVLLQVRDVGSDGEDFRHTYTLSATTLVDPDTNEPNASSDDATALGSSAAQGWIASRGDEDYYAFDAAALDLVELSLAMDVGGIEPRYQIINPDGAVLVSASNPAGTREVTALSHVLSAAATGTFHVVISDEGDDDEDPATPYTVSVSVTANPDPNEPNDHPSDAIALPAQTCTAAWTDFSLSEFGVLATTGDVDWFSVDLTGCTTSLIELGASWDAPTALPAALDLEVRLMREVPGEACVVDQDCTELSIPCAEDLDCAGYGNACLNSHFCGGASLCLPTGSCAARIPSASATTPAGPALLSAPLSGLDTAWIAVADHHGDALSPDHAYTLDGRVRLDPDVNEPNDVYTAGPPVGNAAAYHAPLSGEIPVHDCTLGDCCDSTTWTTGSLSYAYDQDWFRYTHPCPDLDCMVAVHYTLDAGPVDHYLRVFTSTDPWYDNLADMTDPGDQPAVTDVFGGLGTTDECYYAWSGHVGLPFWYFLTVRDTIYVSESAPTGGTWDYSTEQTYGVCIEKTAAGCTEPPCFLYIDGCGVPVQ